jgi:CheY-like chemotaxis protein
MTFARTGSGKEKLVNVVALVNDLMRLLVRIVGERASIVVQNDVEQIWVRAEPIALEQAVVNLVSNARDAVSVGGTILVRVRSVANNTPTEKPVFCLLEVEDDGVGMDTETQRRVFEPFFTTKPASRGTGLGLSVVANVVAHSGGRVELESEPGKGSRFRLYFPAQPPPDNAVLGIRTIMPKTVGNGRLVLVVEDERMLRENMARALQRNGFEVAVAEDLDEATFRCRRCRTAPTLLISDMVLPDGTGRDVAKILEQKWGNVPTLFVSGYIDDEVAHTTELDLKNLMPKPFTPQALLERVAQLLQDQTA